MTEDFSGYLEDTDAPAIGNNAAAALDHMVDLLIEAEEAVVAAEENLKRQKAIAERLRTKDIPEAMEELGTSEWKSTSNGLKVVVEEKILAQPKAADRPRVIAWLEEAGHSGVIKRDLIVPFKRGKDQEQAANELAERLSEEGLEANFNKSVHANTLSSHVRNLLSQGAEIPMELLGVRTVKQAKFKK